MSTSTLDLKPKVEAFLQDPIGIYVNGDYKESIEGEWTKMEAHSRMKLIYKFASLLEENREELAQLESLDNGKPYAAALSDDVDGSIQQFEYYAGFATKILGKTTEVSPDYLNYTLHEPVGVVGQIIPWN